MGNSQRIFFRSLLFEFWLKCLIDMLFIDILLLFIYKVDFYKSMNWVHDGVYETFRFIEMLFNVVLLSIRSVASFEFLVLPIGQYIDCIESIPSTFQKLCFSLELEINLSKFLDLFKWMIPLNSRACGYACHKTIPTYKPWIWWHKSHLSWN